MDHQDYYQTLGVEPAATDRQIKEAYRKLAFKYHPDRTADRPDGAEMMKAVNEAYAVLSNPAKRQRVRHDAAAFRQLGRRPLPPDIIPQQDIFSGSDIQQIFEEVARSFGLRGFDEIFKEFYGQGTQSFRFDQQGLSGRGFFVFGGFGRPGGRAALFWPATWGGSRGPCWKKPAVSNCPKRAPTSPKSFN